ncbi:MAG: hypothetical protein WC325_11150 [Candidatus Bathyarchaeia archaeon]
MNRTLSKIIVVLTVMVFASGGVAGFFIGYNCVPSPIEPTPTPLITPSPSPTSSAQTLFSSQPVLPEPNMSLLRPRIYSLPMTVTYPIETQIEESLKDTYVYPSVLGEIRDYDLNIFLRTNFGFDTCMSFVTDSKYALTSVEQAKNFTAGDIKFPLLIEGHDCDNFASQLWGYWSQGNTSFAFGWAKSGTHAFNFMVDCNLDLYIVEPLTNEFIPFKEIVASNSSTYIPIMFVI